MVGSKGEIPHMPLNCLSPWHQLYWDGHKKIGIQVPNMEEVSLPMYTDKDQFSAFVLIMQVISNVCLEVTISHLFLDMVENYGCISYL